MQKPFAERTSANGLINFGGLGLCETFPLLIGDMLPRVVAYVGLPPVGAVIRTGM